MEKMQYAMVVNYGPKAQNLTHCLSFTPTSSASQKVYTDGYGNKSYGSVDHQITGNDLQNVCAFTIDYSIGSVTGTQTLKPHETTHVDIGLMGSVFNRNTLSFRWIKKH